MTDRDRWAAYQTDIRSNSRVRTRKGVRRTAFQTREFASVDGEGVTRDGKHDYVLLRCGDDELFREDGSALTAYECLDFLASRDPNKIYVGYFFDYDVTKILQGLPVERLERLVRRELRVRKNDPGSCYPVEWGPFAFDYLKNKEFRVRKGDGPWVVISDVGSFFQCSFVKALRSWFPDDEWKDVIDRIEAGKNLRSDFNSVDREYVRQYCQIECNMLRQLMNRFREVCYQLNLHPREWQGPGRLVSAVLAREGYPRNRDVPLWSTEHGKNIAGMANAAYYGGRFEAGMFGDIKGPIYQYDINSAYPSVYRNLPCLMHGQWIPFEGALPNDGLYICDIQYQHKHTVQYAGLPIRSKKGTLLFPLAGRGIYWSYEIRSSLPFLTSYNVFHGYRYIKECDCKPFEWVEPMYQERKKLGKSGKGIVLKLALNSTYGKLCQSVGVPTFANPVHASQITSQTRAQLYEAMMMEGNGNDVIMAATDGIFLTSPRSLQTGNKLGEWEESIHDNIFVVQSGVYYIDGKPPKTRGTAVSTLTQHESDFRELWLRYLPQIRAWKTPEDQCIDSVSVPVQNFISIPLALAWNKPSTAGQWIDDQRNIAFEWFSKRTIFAGETAVTNPHGSHLVTRPQAGSIYGMTVPYTKAIGGVLERIRTDGRQEEMWMMDTQPDWSKGL